MSATWQGDAVGLVEAYRAHEVSPVEIVQASLDAAAADTLNAMTHLDAEGALAAAAVADVSKPFGGVPIVVKELEPRLGWPFEFGTAVLKGVPATYTSIQLQRIEGDGGAIPIGITTSSELGLVAYTNTKIHGATGNPWDPALTPGGSSGGSSAAVASGIVPIATASDGGGSIRIPAGFTGLFGLKTTFRRIPFGPNSPVTQLMSTWGCVSRSVRDSARWLDVAEGTHQRDMWSLPAVGGWERGLGTRSLAGLRVGVVESVCDAIVAPHVLPIIEEAADVLIKAAGLQRVSVTPNLAAPGEEWVKPSLPLMWAGLGAFYPDIKALLTDEVAGALDLASAYTIEDAAAVETFRRTMNESMADLFETCDLLILPTNPDDPYAKEGPPPTSIGGVEVDSFNSGRLTMASNITGIPSVSIPAGLSPNGLPVGLQIWAPRHRDDWLLDLALVLERERPWPLVTTPGRR